MLAGTISCCILWNFCRICISYCKSDCIWKFVLIFWRGICLHIVVDSIPEIPCSVHFILTTMTEGLYLCCADSHHSIQNSTTWWTGVQFLVTVPLIIQLSTYLIIQCHLQHACIHHFGFSFSHDPPLLTQGNLQGFISASKSFANIVTPLVMCPVTGMNSFSALQIRPEI
jgi:hypothetical protein